MIVTVQGTLSSTNNASGLLAALSVIGYAKEQKKSLILQFTDKREDSVEELLFGQTLRNESLIADTSIPDVSVGMDPLIAKTRNYDKKIFTETTKALITAKQTNLFDVAYVSRKESFCAELLSREADIKIKDHGEQETPGIIESILTAAKEVYDIVYVLLPANNRTLSRKLLEYADASIVCVRQGRVENFVELEKSKAKKFICVNDFDFGAGYNSKTIAKLYGVHTVFGLLHNVGFKDAQADGVVLDFIIKNRKAAKTDVNYDFIHNITLLYDSLMGNKGKKEKDFDEDEMERIDKDCDVIRVWAPINETPVVIVKKYGLFKNKTDETITLLPDTEVESVQSDEYFDTDEELSETESEFDGSKNLVTENIQVEDLDDDSDETVDDATDDPSLEAQDADNKN